jgi:hypothetical protein
MMPQFGFFTAIVQRSWRVKGRVKSWQAVEPHRRERKGRREQNVFFVSRSLQLSQFQISRLRTSDGALRLAYDLVTLCASAEFVPSPLAGEGQDEG